LVSYTVGAPPAANVSRASSRPSAPWPTIRSGGGARGAAMAWRAVAASASSVALAPVAAPSGTTLAPLAMTMALALANRPHIDVAIGAGHEDELADAPARFRACLEQFAHGLAAGDQRVAHAGEHRHAAGPQKFFGPCENAGPRRAHNRFGGLGITQGDLAQIKRSAGFEDDGAGSHRVSLPSGLMRPRAASLHVCQCR